MFEGSECHANNTLNISACLLTVGLNADQPLLWMDGSGGQPEKG